MAQKLMTKAIEKKAQKFELYSQEKKGMNAITWLKFFSPVGAFTWYVTEAQKQEDGDWLFFGLVVNNYGEKELGYFTLSQLQEVRLPFGLRIERDIYFSETTLNNIAA